MKLTLIAAQSVDGFIAKHSVYGSQFTSEADRAHLREALAGFDFYLMGAETYRVIRNELLGKLKPGLLRVVVTHHPEVFTSDAVSGILEFSSEPLPQLVARLTQNGQCRGAILGGAQIYLQCLELNLVSQCWLTIEPRLFGAGTALLGREIDVALKFAGQQKLSDDTLLLKYDVISTVTPARPMHWGFYFTLWLLGVIALGAGVGAVIFPLVGKMIGSEKTLSGLMIYGVKFMAFYFMIWAPAIAIVATVARQYRLRK